jgi:hypothetical protein
MCYLDFDETASVWHEETRTARKQHVCDCCGGLIRRGTEYVRHFSVFDGDATSQKSCAACVVMTAAFRGVHGAAGTPGSMRPLLDECIDSETREGHTKTATMWRAELRKMDARRATARKKPPTGEG